MLSQIVGVFKKIASNHQELEKRGRLDSLSDS